MLKRDRLQKILNQVNQEGSVSTSELIELLNVSDMTIRRDLDELNVLGKIIRVHGGAQSLQNVTMTEPSMSEKRNVHTTEKKAIAKIASTYIRDGETVFIGTGTTLELLAQTVHIENLRVVTNSLPVFECIQGKPENWNLILIGGEYRKKSGAFTGSIANSELLNIKFDKTFIGVNGIHDESMMNASADEGVTQEIALNNARKRFLIADSSKLNRDDFYRFYDLSDIDAFITDKGISKDLLDHYGQYTEIIK